MAAFARLLLAFGLGSAMLVAAPAARAATLRTLYVFSGGADGLSPAGDLLLRDGILYGTTLFGGPNSGCGGRGCGTVFALDPATRTLTTLTTLHGFTGGLDGGNPTGGLAVDAAGALYGTTGSGGTTDCGGTGCGTVFKLDPTTHTLRTVHAFTDGADSANPNSGMLLSKGILYGTTGGYTGNGTIFAVDLGTGMLTTLYSFCALSQCADGISPNGGLASDATGALYGTTFTGGRGSCNLFGCGTVYKFDPATRMLTTLHSFGSRSGSVTPQTGVVFLHGSIFGTSGVQRAGRHFYSGAVFKVDPATQHFEILHEFTGIDGGDPLDLAARARVLYGTTSSGGGSNYGTVFRLGLETGRLETLFSFSGDVHGETPEGGVVLDTTGALYGSTFYGGSFAGACSRVGCGTLFELIP